MLGRPERDSAVCADIRDHCSGVAGEQPGATPQHRATAERAHCFSRIGEATAEQAPKECASLLHAVGERDIGGSRVATSRTKSGRELEDIFEMTGCAPSEAVPVRQAA